MEGLFGHVRRKLFLSCDWDEQSTRRSKKDADDNTILALVKRDRNCQTKSRPLQQLLLIKNFTQLDL